MEFQRRFGDEILLPWLAEHGWNPKHKRVLEVGCSEGGLLELFAQRGAVATGAELSVGRVQHALELRQGQYDVVQADICDPDDAAGLGRGYDLIVLRDVIEHLLDREAAFANMRGMLAAGGKIAVTFPPWYMPFGGHQQALHSFWRLIPFTHWLPWPLYKAILKHGTKARPRVYDDLVSTRKTGLTIKAFHTLLRRTGYASLEEKRWLVNPAYKIKFNMKPRLAGAAGKIPWLREGLVTSVHCLLRRADDDVPGSEEDEI
jgi:SAM-dependent methyltransferase